MEDLLKYKIYSETALIINITPTHQTVGALTIYNE